MGRVAQSVLRLTTGWTVRDRIGSDCMDDSTYGGVPHVKAKTFVAQRLHRLSATRQVEGLSESRQTTNRGELPQYYIMDTHNIPNVMVHHSLASKTGLNPSPTLSYMEDKGVNQ